MDSVIWHERKALYPLKKKQLSVIFNSFQHWTITLYFHMNFISKLRVFLTNKRLQNRHRVPRCRMPVLQNFLLMKVVARMDRDSSLLLLSIAVHCWVQTLSIFGYSVQFCVRSGRFGKKILNTLYFFCLVFFLFVHTYEWFIYVLQFVLNKFIEKCKRQSLLKWKVSVNLNLCPFLRQPPINRIRTSSSTG